MTTWGVSNPILESVIQRRREHFSKVKRGEEIFTGTDYPRTFTAFIGQEQAIQQLRAAINSAKQRHTRLDHTLLASGHHGIGKTTLAMIVAAEMDTGFLQVSGPITVDDARDLMRAAKDDDILFWDEFHTAVKGSSTRADWLLPFLTDAVLLTKNGVEPMPKVTVVAATTDAGRLPQTILSRFMVRPRFVVYTSEEQERIAANLAARMRVRIAPRHLGRIARAANGNPREMRMIITAIRDLALTHGGKVDLQTAFRWAGVTYDGLTQEAQDIMLALMLAPGLTASLETIQATLGEPGPLRHAEQLLIQRGYITISGRGRTLTEDGYARGLLLVEEEGI